MKSQLTFSKELLETVGFEVYRTRTECKCTPGQDRRDAIIGIMEYDEAVMVKVIRCRGCVNRKEAGNV
ncbi:MAG: hypothetical protein Q7U54_07935 [Bacteroidales bacterium]|nr:hypothetical protein [Bacteroidales bacterium]